MFLIETTVPSTKEFLFLAYVGKCFYCLRRFFLFLFQSHLMEVLSMVESMDGLLGCSVGINRGSHKACKPGYCFYIMEAAMHARWKISSNIKYSGRQIAALCCRQLCQICRPFPFC